MNVGRSSQGASEPSWPILALIAYLGSMASGQVRDVVPVTSDGLQPRPRIEVGPVHVPAVSARVSAELPRGRAEYRLVVKFMDVVRARRGLNGELRSVSRLDLSAVQVIAESKDLEFTPLIRLSETSLGELEERAARRSGRAQPDLAGMFVVGMPEASADGLARIGQELQETEVVEFAHIEVIGVPPPGDIAPPTPDITIAQKYLGPNPGMNVKHAWSLGLRGAGIRLSDCEYAWNPDHEDLNEIDTHPEAGQTIPLWIYYKKQYAHGTAVLGIGSSGDNGYGTTGICSAASVYTYPEVSMEEGARRVTAITHAIAASSPGDVVLLEMQDIGAGGGYAPAETNPAVFVVTKVGTDAGVVVVAAAGNGAQDLDTAAYLPYMSMGDSGAIIVGAGSKDVAHQKLWFSTYGTRVDVQGWGASVVTLGYGTLMELGGDRNQRYTASFSGTSAASALVAAACCVVQECAVDVFGVPLDSVTMREVLRTTGCPTWSGKIGPLPDVGAAIEYLPALAAPWMDLHNALAGAVGEPVLAGEGALQGGDAVALTLSNALGNAWTTLVVGASSIYAPTHGGILVPAPDVVLPPLMTRPSGTSAHHGTWPTGVPPGFVLFFQQWIVDPAGPAGFSASNALLALAP